MAQITVIVEDVVQGTTQSMQLDDDIPVNILILNLIKDFNLPSVDGDIDLSYVLDYPLVGSVLDYNQTLESAGVQENDTLQIRSVFNFVNSLQRTPPQPIPGMKIKGYSDERQNVSQLQIEKIKDSFVYLSKSPSSPPTQFINSLSGVTIQLIVDVFPKKASKPSSEKEDISETLAISSTDIPSISSPIASPLPQSKLGGLVAFMTIYGGIIQSFVKKFHQSLLSMQEPNQSSYVIYPRIQSSSDIHTTSKMISLDHSEIFLNPEKHLLEDLIDYKPYDNIWRIFAYGQSGWYLTTGYGSFGATTLMKCAMEKARSERAEKAFTFLAIHFTVTQETANDYTMEVDSVSINHPKLLGRLGGTSYWKHNRASIQKRINNITNKKCEKFGATFFNLSKRRRRKAKAVYISRFQKFIDDLNIIFMQNRDDDHNDIYKIAYQLLGEKPEIDRIIIIIDKMKFQDNLNRILTTYLLNDEKIRVFFVVNREHFNTWNISTEMLKQINFREHIYVSCSWNIDICTLLVDRRKIEEKHKQYHLFSRYLEYHGRGSIGNMITKLREAHVTQLTEDGAYIDLDEFINNHCC